MPRLPGTKKKRPTTRAETGPFCNARRQDGSGKRCMQPAGWATDHPGQGRCKRHGGRKPPPMPVSKVTQDGEIIVLKRYNKIQRHELRDLTNRVAVDETEITDLSEEVHLLRAILIQYVDNYDEFVEALLAWYAEPDVKQKPRRIMDISDASSLIESVSRVVERMHKIKSEGSIDLATFRRVIEQMGIVVARHVKDQLALQRIDAEWGTLALDAKKTELPWRPEDDEPPAGSATDQEDTDGEESEE